MLENLQTVSVFSPSLSAIVSNVIVSLICSFVISLVYRYTYKGPGYSDSFVNSIIFLSVTTTIVIMVIGNNLAYAFGLVGALSIIRFRTAIKDTIDIVYIFLGLALGMAAGVGYHKIAIAGTLLMSAILILFTKPNFKYFRTAQYMLQFNYLSENGAGEEFTGILKKYCRRYEVMNIRANDFDKSLDYTFYILVKKPEESKQIIDELKSIKGIQKLNIFFDQENS
jgi:uncharacterized membrane protein YhiD involved in acid resistance